MLLQRNAPLPLHNCVYWLKRTRVGGIKQTGWEKKDKVDRIDSVALCCDSHTIHVWIKELNYTDSAKTSSGDHFITNRSSRINKFHPLLSVFLNCKLDSSEQLCAVFVLDLIAILLPCSQSWLIIENPVIIPSNKIHNRYKFYTESSGRPFYPPNP